MVKLIDLALIGISAGMSYADARDANRATFEGLEKIRGKVLLGEQLTPTEVADADRLIEAAQKARKAARAAVPVPTN